MLRLGRPFVGHFKYTRFADRRLLPLYSFEPAIENALATRLYSSIDMASKVYNIAIVGNLLIDNRVTCRLRTCWRSTYFSTLNNDSPENPLQCISHRQFQEILDVPQYEVHRAITLETIDERRGTGIFVHA